MNETANILVQCGGGGGIRCVCCADPPPPPELSPGVHNDVVIPIVYVTRHSSGCRLPYFRRRVTRATNTTTTNKTKTQHRINDERDIPYIYIEKS